MKQLMLIATIVVAGALFADEPAAPAGKPSRHTREGGASDPIVRMVASPRMAEKLGLTEEQKAKIKEIESSSRKTISELRKQMRDARAKESADIRAVLTPEQTEKAIAEFQSRPRGGIYGRRAPVEPAKSASEAPKSTEK